MRVYVFYKIFDIPGKHFCISKTMLFMISFDINDCKKIQMKIQLCSIFFMLDYLNGINEGVSFMKIRERASIIRYCDMKTCHIVCKLLFVRHKQYIFPFVKHLNFLPRFWYRLLNRNTYLSFIRCFTITSCTQFANIQCFIIMKYT